MALIKCKDCKQKFSTDAKRCPHCGATKKGGWGFWIIAALLGWYAAHSLSASEHTLASNPASAKSSPNAAKAPSWFVTEDNSKMDGSKTVVLAKDAEGAISVWLHQVKPTLIVRCQEKKTDLYLITESAADPELGKYNKYTVEIRIDDQKPYKELWAGSTNTKSLFAPNAASLSRKLAKAKRVLIRFTPFNSSPATSEFDLTGLNALLPKVASTCKWENGE